MKLKENVAPQFFKPRTVPFALKEKVTDELKRLERIVVPEKVETSDWATPIVPILKPDVLSEFCVDYRITIAPRLCSSFESEAIPYPQKSKIVLSSF